MLNAPPGNPNDPPPQENFLHESGPAVLELDGDGPAIRTLAIHLADCRGYINGNQNGMGRVYISTVRLLFMPHVATRMFQSFSIPLDLLKEYKCSPPFLFWDGKIEGEFHLIHTDSVPSGRASSTCRFTIKFENPSDYTAFANTLTYLKTSVPGRAELPALVAVQSPTGPTVLARPVDD